MSIEAFLQTFALIFGLIIGSFLNALIYRLPRGIPIGLPRSRCRSCAKVIRWYENIPILSWLFLRGKCSQCFAAISIRYPLVELTTGLFALYIAPGYIDSFSLLNFFYYLTLFSLLLSIFLIDIDFKLIPNVLNIYLGLVLITFNFFHISWVQMLLGFSLGFFLPLGVTWLFYLLRGKVGLGGGDIKLYGVLGIALGPVGIIQNIFLSCFLGAFVGLSLIMMKVIDRNTPIPFGPYIVVVASFQLFFPNSFTWLWQKLFF